MHCNKPFDDGLCQTLLTLARHSIAHGISHHTPLPIDMEKQPDAFLKLAACFVTLKKHGELRGCIGTLEAYRPLIEDVLENAFAAAFRDPRFSPVSADELTDITLSISILSQPEPFPVSDEQALLSQLKPGIDGLILRDGYHRATFLPSVWEELPHAADFLLHLKYKAGLPGNYWSDTLTFQRYYADVIK